MNLNFDLVIYDEIEKFRKYDDPLFNYPFVRRKSKVFAVMINPFFFSLLENGLKMDDYMFPQVTAKF